LEGWKKNAKEKLTSLTWNEVEPLYSKIHFLVISLLQEIKALQSGEVSFSFK
jgi:hypothetical protein